MLSKGKLVFQRLLSCVALVIGIPSALFWGVGMFAVTQPDLEDPEVFLTVCLIFFAVSLFLVVFALTRLLFLQSCKRFWDILSTRNVRNVPQLAGILGLSQDKTRSVLQKMVSKRYITGVYLDCRDNTIGFVDEKLECDIPVVAVKCPNCGGTNQIPMNGSGKCSYCDSAIKA